MSVREKINSHPAFTAIFTVIAVAAIVFVLLPKSGAGDAASLLNRAFFTTDDSSPSAAKAALFSDSSSRLPPFQKDGKNAYLAMVFSCDSGKTTWVGYLQRYTPQGLERMRMSDQSKTDATQSVSLSKSRMDTQGIQIKRPGDKQWTDFSDMRRATEIISVKCPDGSNAIPTIVTP